MRLLGELRDRIAAHAQPGLTTPIDGLLLSRVTTAEPYHVLTEPLLIVMAQGGKRLLLGDQVFEYRSGQYLIVTAELAVTGHFLNTDARNPSFAVAVRLRPTAIAALLLQAPVRDGRERRRARRSSRRATSTPNCSMRWSAWCACSTGPPTSPCWPR